MSGPNGRNNNTNPYARYGGNHNNSFSSSAGYNPNNNRYQQHQHQHQQQHQQQQQQQPPSNAQQKHQHHHQQQPVHHQLQQQHQHPTTTRNVPYSQQSTQPHPTWTQQQQQQQQQQSFPSSQPHPPAPHNSQPQAQPQSQAPPAAPESQEKLIQTLQKQLEDKDEENFDLAASLSAVEAETNFRIETLEQESKLKIQKLEEQLRRAQQEANRARAALKTKSNTATHTANTTNSNKPPAPQQQPPQPPVPPVPHNINSNVQHPSKTTANNIERYPKTVTVNNNSKSSPHSKNGSVSPSPHHAASSRPPFRHQSPNHILGKRKLDLANHNDGYSSSSAKPTTRHGTIVDPKSLARYLLQQLATSSASSRRPQDDVEQLRLFLTAQITATTSNIYNDTDSSNQHFSIIIWGLIHHYIDHGNTQALALLSLALIRVDPLLASSTTTTTTTTCRALMQAAGWGDMPSKGSSMTMDYETIDDEHDNGSAKLLKIHSNIRIMGGGAATTTPLQRQLQNRLQSISAGLKQPLSRLTSQHDYYNGFYLANSSPSSSERTSFTPKQEYLARQLLETLVDALDPTSHKNNNDNSHPQQLDVDALHVLTRLLSSLRRVPCIKSLEPILFHAVARLQAHSQQCLRLRCQQPSQSLLLPGQEPPPPLSSDTTQWLLRGYDTLKPLRRRMEILDEEVMKDSDNIMQEEEGDENDDGDDKATSNQQDNGATSGRQLPSPNHQGSNLQVDEAHHHQQPSLLLVVEDLDPMLCELCRQLDRLLQCTVVAQSHDENAREGDHGDDYTVSSKKDFIHQWRKAVLANACDILEHDLLPLLLELGHQRDGGVPPHLAAASPPSLSPGTMAAWQEWVPWFTSLVNDKAGRRLLRTEFPLVSSSHFRTSSQSTTTTTGDNEANQNGDDSGGGMAFSSIKDPDLSCSAMGVVIQLLRASVMVEQSHAPKLASPALIQLCRTIRTQCLHCLHAWLLCPAARLQGELTFLEVVSEFVDDYKSACSFILHQKAADGAANSDDDIVTMVQVQLEELLLDEDDAALEREERYGKYR